MVRYISDYGVGAREERDDEWRTEALANFPFELVETRGEDALAEWQELKTAGRGVPVVVGDLDGVLEPFSPGYHETLKPVQETLAAASAIRFPQGLAQMRHDQNVAAWEMLRRMGDSVDLDDEAFQVREPPLGEGPPSPSGAPGLSVGYERLTQQPLPTAHIAFVPTTAPTTVPAHLHSGDS